MLPGNSRWIEKSIMWFWPILKFGVYEKTALPAGSVVKGVPEGRSVRPGTSGFVAVGAGIDAAGTTGRGPSKPARKTDRAGSDELAVQPWYPATVPAWFPDRL